MIVVRLLGGLGNQMFQYATGRRLALHHHTTLHLDLSWFACPAPGETPRAYALGPFAVDAALDGAELLPRSLRVPSGRGGRLLELAVPSRRRAVLRQSGPGFVPEAFAAPDGAVLIGYWQSERYFADVADRIRAELRLTQAPSARNAALLERIRAGAALSVHVRRGDYLTEQARRYHGAPTAEWYRAALEHALAQAEIDQVLVFSDDPDWCRTNITPSVPTTYVDHNGDEPHEDLRLMSACRHHVLANSSFSWWGAWLDPHPGALVVAPKRWFADPEADDSAVHAAGWTAL